MAHKFKTEHHLLESHLVLIFLPHLLRTQKRKEIIILFFAAAEVVIKVCFYFTYK